MGMLIFFCHSVDSNRKGEAAITAEPLASTADGEDHSDEACGGGGGWGACSFQGGPRC